MNQQKRAACLFISIILIFSLFPFSLPAAPEKISVAVYDLVAKGVSDQMTSTLSDVLRNTLFQTGLFKMLTKEDMRQVLDNLAARQLVEPDCLTDACLAEIAGVLGVEMMISGSVGKLGKTYVINLRLVDSESADTINTVSLTCACADDLLIAKIEEAGLQLVKLKSPREAKLDAAKLLAAAKAGDLKQVKLLIEKQVQLNTADKDGVTPLHAASFQGHSDIVKLLLEKGALIDAKTSFYQTPLLFAAFGGHLGVVEILISHGADVDIKTSAGESPLDMAVKEGHEEVVKLLKTR